MEEVHLGATVANMKKFQGLKKFRVAAKAVLAINRLCSVSSDKGDSEVVTRDATIEVNSCDQSGVQRSSSFDLFD